MKRSGDAHVNRTRRAITNYKKLAKPLIISFFLIILAGCNQHNQREFKVNFEKFRLANGLEVIFHIDTSDPVTAVALTFHVGSAREKKGRTGFAHLFEHLLFLESENLGKGGLDKMSARIGGSGANGTTSRDRTNYFQTVPNDALEKMIWAEAEKLGYFINTVTEAVLAKEKQVVKNEKRQGVDNRPYGHTRYVIDKHLYTGDHPYNWQVIGSLEDLQNATLEDVKEFYRKWYVPNNATLVIAGDFDPQQAKEWVKKYFAEIPRGEKIDALAKKAGNLVETKKLYYEDNFARLPELNVAWPSVPQYHKDSYPLDVLAELLAGNKKSPFYKVLIEEKKLTSRVFTGNQASELAGSFRLRIRAFAGKKLDDVNTAIAEAFAKFEADGISNADLNRIKAGQETVYYNSLSSVLGKAFQLAQYKIFANDPGFINQDIKNILAVTKEDVMRVYKQYIKGKHTVVTSFVPKGETNLALSGSEPAEVVEEKIVQGAEQDVNPNVNASYEKTPSSFDRSVEPPYGKTPVIKVPEIWEDELANGMKLYGIQNSELPMVQFNIQMSGGLLLDNPEKIGVANLVAELMNAGTKNKTPEELEEVIDLLGASIRLFSGDQTFGIRVNTLAKNYPAVLDLTTEMLLEPRWDETEFELAKQRIISDLNQQKADPNSIATNEFAKLIYDQNHILSNNSLGTAESVASITLEDLKSFYEKKLSPSIARMHVAGDIDQTTVKQSLENLVRKWQPIDVIIPAFKMPERPTKSTIYFYDVPNAKQSVIRFGYPALAATNTEYYPAIVMNYILGGGGFASTLTQQLRETKGYTYRIFSTFVGTDIPGPFLIASRIRTNVTLEAAELIQQILRDYGKNYSDQDMETTKNFLLKSNARAFETLDAKLNILENISSFNWPYDYINQREKIVRDMTVDKINALSAKFLNADKMIYLFVGDAKTQMSRLKNLGYGNPIKLNK